MKIPEWIKELGEFIATIIVQILDAIVRTTPGGGNVMYNMSELARMDTEQRIPIVQKLRKQHLYAMWGWIWVFLTAAAFTYISFSVEEPAIQIGIFFCFLILISIIIIIYSALKLHKLKKSHPKEYIKYKI